MILTAMRSGSTYLANMLWDTGLLAYPDLHDIHASLKPQAEVFEFMAPNHNVDPWDVRKFPKIRDVCIQQLKFKFSFQPDDKPCLFKILKEQFDYYLLENTDRPFIEAQVPGVKYIWLERKDKLARAVSAYQFFVTKMPHLWDEKMLKEYRSKDIPWDPKGMLDVYYNHVKDCDWYGFLHPLQEKKPGDWKVDNDSAYLKVEYEDLIARPTYVLSECVSFLGYGAKNLNIQAIVNKQPKIKTERAETQEYIKKLTNLLKAQL
jgi:LPS sulfotransferase NodH